MLSTRGLACRLLIGGLIVTAVLYRHLALSIAFSLTNAVMFACSLLSLALFQRYTPRNSPLDRVVVCFDALNILSLASLLGGLLSYAFAAMSVGWRDSELLAADRMLGLNWLAYWNFVQSHPMLCGFLNIGYQSIFVTPMIFLLALAATGITVHAYRIIAAFITALFATDVLLAFVPGKSAAALLLPAMAPNAPAPGLMHIPIIEHLRAGTFGPVDVGHLDGLIAFPSFHSAAAILFAFAAWPVRWLRIPGVGINALMLAATPIQGGHYFIDTLAGIVVALGALALTWRLPAPSLAIPFLPGMKEERLSGSRGQLLGA